MSTTRREFLTTSIGCAAALSAVRGVNAKPLPGPGRRDASELVLPAKGDFSIPDGVTYINCAYTHPMPNIAAEAVRAYIDRRSRPEAVSKSLGKEDVKAEFAALINAQRSEISFVPNTSTGENLIVNALGIPHTDGNVVTDALHFEGALLHLGELQKRNGLDLRVVMPRDWRIDMKDMERVVDNKTKLIELSLVAMDNGFEHDLKAVCDLAHAHGAYVYADIVQAAGNSPIDVRATGVDFCACSSFKWLMGDFGLGFLFVKEDLLDRVIGRTQYGYFQAKSLDSHLLPGEPSSSVPYTWELETDATGHFEVGTDAIGVSQALGQSLPYIRRIGVEAIQAHRQPMLKKLREEMPRLGYEPLTPPESTSALISFSVKDYKPVAERLERAKVNVRLGRHFLRVSPSVFNDMKDIDRLLEALS